MKSILRCVALSLWIAGLTAPAIAQAPDATLRSTPDTVIWGYFSADLPPALTIKSGQTVKIDTVSHQGLMSKDDPATFFGSAGIPPDQVLQDAKDIYAKVFRVKGLSAHVLTGPIYIEGAEPGDMLEVRTHKFDLRVPYGVNNSGPRTGVLGDLLSAPTPKIIKLDLARNVALFSPEIEVPLAPFMGIMAVAPPRDVLLVSSRPQARWGGNMDFNKLSAGSTLYLPVFNTGAQFFTGDSHAVQGDGEVNGTAIEASLTATMQFIVRKGEGRAMRWPRAEDAANYYVMGIDLDLDSAMHEAVQEAVDFLRERFGLSAADAYALASIGVDFRVAEAVDSTQVIYGAIPKKLFKTKPGYWRSSGGVRVEHFNRLSLPGLTGQSSNPCAIAVSETLPHLESGGYWIARSSVQPGHITDGCSGTWLTHHHGVESAAKGAIHALARGVGYGSAA